MKYRVLGKTGLNVSELGFGGIPIVRLATDEAVAILRHAFDRGITFYDTANAYKDSEAKMGIAFSGIRDKVVLATKTLKRDAAGAKEQLENSLRMLQTDYIDLYQFHQVAQEKDWAAISAPGGALEVVVKAQQEGKIRHIGVSSHGLPMAIKLLKMGLFTTIQFPFNFIETDPSSELHVLAREMNIGILAMKPFAGGVIDNGPLAFKFLRQYPDVLAIPGYDSVAAVDNIVDLYDQPNVVDSSDLALMDKYRAELGKRFCRRCEYCLPCPHGVNITPAMGYPIMAARMSPQIAASRQTQIMETVVKCTQCGVCISRCPYELPIPEILRKNYDLFESHRASL
ncbi:MAG: aldo/keto reductase [Negativicutes bacterium]|nr:aldo/keto reductase [Negativicutes bacterium]MDR3590736.1 aldo/keto reductase [Negativicutes bacterium]